MNIKRLSLIPNFYPLRGILSFFLLFLFLFAPLHTVHAESAWDSYTAGLEAMEAGDCVAAKKHFNDAIAKDPQDRKIRRGMFFDHYLPNAKLKELGPCPQGDVSVNEPIQIVLFSPVSNSAEYPNEVGTVEVKWRVTGGSGTFSVTVDGNQVTADTEGLYTSSLSLEPGDNTFTLSAFDKELKKVESVRLNLNRLPPPPMRITLLSPTSENTEYPYEDESVLVKWMITGGSGTFTVTVDGKQVQPDGEGLYTLPLSLEPGDNTITLSAFDKEIKKIESVRLNLNRLPPPSMRIALLSPTAITAEYPYEDKTVQVKWLITGGSGQYSVTVDGKQIKPDAEGMYTTSLPLETGENSFALSAFDKHYNTVESAKLQLTRLPPPPLGITLLQPTSNISEYPYEQKTVDVRWRITGGSGNVSVTVGGTPIQADSEGLYTVCFPLHPGENTINLSVFDRGYKQTETSKLFLKRLPPPPLKMLLLNPIADTARYQYEDKEVALKWRLTGGSGQATVTVNGTPAPADSLGIYNFSYSLREGENTIEIVAFDNELGPDKAETMLLHLTRLEPPPLELFVADDTNNTRTNNDTIVLRGKASGMVDGVTLTVNGQNITLMGDGRFEHVTSLVEGKNDLKIRLVDGLKRVQTADVSVMRTLNPLAGVDVGNFYAMIIANNNYQDPQIKSLETPINDAREIAKVLRENYGFTVKVLENATREDIILAFNEFRNMLTEKDNFLVYYAGHGVLDQAEDEGYWLPVDAKKEIDDKWIPNSTISNKMRAIKARHVLLIADSCYSGTLAKTRNLTVRKKEPGYLKEIIEKKSRLVLSSGGEEPVADDGGRKGHSVFASGFLKEIESNDSILESADLYMNVKKYVRNAKDQIPAYSELPKTGHELGGDFLFIRKE